MSHNAIANIPLSELCLDVLATKANVFIVGSLVKHARCGEGLGFLTYSRGQDCIIQEPESGWTAFPSGLQENKTADFDSNHLLYDSGLEWDGGTPAWVESAYVATRIISSMPTIEDQHRYVKAIQEDFLDRAKHLLSEGQLASLSESNTLALPVSKVVSPLPFGLDYKVVNGTTYLRIGFGVQNLHYHLDTLMDVLERTGALE